MIFSLLILVAIIAAVIYNSGAKRKKLEALRLAYEQSLKGSDKRVALNAGRNYYGALRKDKVLTIYDEQAITNDLSTMTDHGIIMQAVNQPG